MVPSISRRSIARTQSSAQFRFYLPFAPCKRGEGGPIALAMGGGGAFFDRGTAAPEMSSRFKSPSPSHAFGAGPSLSPLTRGEVNGGAALDASSITPSTRNYRPRIVPAKCAARAVDHALDIGLGIGQGVSAADHPPVTGFNDKHSCFRRQNRRDALDSHGGRAPPRCPPVSPRNRRHGAGTAHSRIHPLSPPRRHAHRR